MADGPDGNGFAQRYSVIIQTITVVALGIAGFFTTVIQPIVGRQEKLETELRTSIQRSEHEEFKLRIDRDIARIDAARLRDKTDVVPRTEHDARWEATSKDIRLLSDRLNELRTSTTSTFTIRDEVQRLEADLRDIRTRLVPAAPR